MGEYIQCPVCLQWLNLELRDAKPMLIEVDGAKTIHYSCAKCGSVFDDDNNIIYNAYGFPTCDLNSYKPFV